MKVIRIMSLLLVMVLLFTSCAASFAEVAKNEKEEVTLESVDEMLYDEYGVPDVTSTEDGMTATLSVEGSLVKCSYEKDTEEYILSIDENDYYLDVVVRDDVALVGFADSMYDAEIYESEVVGQAVLAGALAFGYLTPALVKAATVVIGVVVGVVATATTYYSIDLVATTINDVRDGSLTLPRTRPIGISNSRWKSASKEITKIKTARKSNATAYYKAVLENNDVYILPNSISFSQAAARLRSGRDIFATTRSAARTLGRTASPSRAIREDVNEKGDGYYPHVHPIGLKWYQSSRKTSYAHIWYPRT